LCPKVELGPDKPPVHAHPATAGAGGEQFAFVAFELVASGATPRLVVPRVVGATVGGVVGPRARHAVDVLRCDRGGEARRRVRGSVRLVR